MSASFVVRWLTSSHHLRENQLSAFGTNFWKLRSENNGPHNARCTPDGNRQRRSQVVGKQSGEECAKRRHSQEHH